MLFSKMGLYIYKIIFTNDSSKLGVPLILNLRLAFKQKVIRFSS